MSEFNCWRCNAQLSDHVTLCHACGAVQSPRGSQVLTELQDPRDCDEPHEPYYPRWTIFGEEVPE